MSHMHMQENVWNSYGLNIFTQGARFVFLSVLILKRGASKVVLPFLNICGQREGGNRPSATPSPDGNLDDVVMRKKHRQAFSLWVISFVPCLCDG